MARRRVLLRVLLALVLGLAAAPGLGGAARTVVPFSYGWRFHYGPQPGEQTGPNNGGFPQNITGKYVRRAALADPFSFCRNYNSFYPSTGPLDSFITWTTSSTSAPDI